MYVQTGPVIVKLEGGSTSTHTWATRVTVDRKGNLHIYGHHRQHIVHLEGEWTAYVVSAFLREEASKDSISENL